MWIMLGCCTELIIWTSRRILMRSASVSILLFLIVLMATSWPVSLFIPNCTFPYVPCPSFLIMSNLANDWTSCLNVMDGRRRGRSSRSTKYGFLTSVLASSYDYSFLLRQCSLCRSLYYLLLPVECLGARAGSGWIHQLTLQLENPRPPWFCV